MEKIGSWEDPKSIITKLCLEARILCKELLAMISIILIWLQHVDHFEIMQVA